MTPRLSLMMSTWGSKLTSTRLIGLSTDHWLDHRHQPIGSRLIQFRREGGHSYKRVNCPTVFIVSLLATEALRYSAITSSNLLYFKQPDFSHKSTTMENIKVTSEDFEKTAVLGKGAYGTVYCVRKVGGSDDGHLYALKEMKKTTKSMSYILNEREVLERVRGEPFVVKLHYTFETDTDLNFVLDYVNGGDLYQQSIKKGSFKTNIVQSYVSELVVAIEKLHKLKIVHRDIKLQNILLDKKSHIVLCDFGLSRHLSDEKMVLDRCGTPQYIAPEVLKKSQGYPYAADWWALGIVTFELITGHSPFKLFVGDNSPLAIFRRILGKSPPFPKTMDTESKLFIESLLIKDPARRLGTRGIQEIKEHPFFNGVEWETLENVKASPLAIEELL